MALVPLAIAQSTINIAFIILLIGMTVAGGLFGLYVIWRSKG